MRPQPPTTTEKKSPLWLRILEISARLIILTLGVAAFYQRVYCGNTTFIAFLAISLIIFEIVQIIRIFDKERFGTAAA
jgi:hypothetical protein